MREASGTREMPGVAAVSRSAPEEEPISIKYPGWLNGMLILFGILAFLLVGFYGYRDVEAITPGRFYEVPPLHDLFHFAWPLFIWFCALIILFLIAVFRSVQHRSKLVASLGASVVTIALAVVIFLDPQLVNQMLDTLVRLVNATSGQALVYTAINLGLITLYWLFAISGWIGRVRRGRKTKAAANTTRNQEQSSEGDKTTWSEMIAGDLVTAAILCFILTLLFSTDSLLFFSRLGAFITQNSAPTQGIAICTVTWPFGQCSAGALNNPPMLMSIDFIQALVYLPLGLLLLGIVSLLPILPDARQKRAFANWWEEAQFIVAEVLGVLQAPLARFIRVIWTNLLVVVRNVAWPILIFLGIACAALAAHYIQQYLHLQSDFHTCTNSLCSVYAQIQQDKASQQQLAALVKAAAASAAGTFFIVLSAAILHGNWQGARELLRFLALIGFGLLLVFWCFSLALSGVNTLLGFINVSGRMPFPWFGFSTLISLGAFLCIGVWWVFWGRGGRWGNVSAAPK